MAVEKAALVAALEASPVPESVGVVYVPAGRRLEAEDGALVRVTEAGAFVRFGPSPTATPKLCRFADLELLHPLCDGSCGDPEPHGLHHEPLGGAW